MGLLRLGLQVDRAFLLAAFGLAAAMAIPLAGVLATSGLEPTIEADGRWLALAGDGAAGGSGGAGLSLPARPEPVWVLGERLLPDGTAAVAFVEGPPVVGRGQAYDGGPAGRNVTVGGLALRTVAGGDVGRPVGPGVVLVHPDDLAGLGGRVRLRAALYDRPVEVPGADVQPARGSDGFEARGIADLQAGSRLLVAVTLPLVAVVAVAFSRLEARRLARWSGVLGALGHPRRAFLLVAARSAALAALAAAAAGLAVPAAAAAGLAPGTGLPLRTLAWTLALPAATAFLAGAATGGLLARRTLADLRHPPSLGDEPRVAELPLRLRPWVVGWRLAGIVFLVGLVASLDVGLPLAASQVPAALAGDRDEWVLGPDSGRVTLGRVAEAPARVLEMDPAIDAIVAEAYVPTLLRGEPALLRGGEWADVADYHGLRLARGEPPGPGEMAVGEALAQRSGLAVGDAAWVVGDDGRLARLVVSGTYRGPDALEDEAVIGLDDARRLATLPAGQANALRIRPDTEEAVQALRRRAPLIEFLDLEVVPADAPAGSIATARLEAVNLSGAAGSRTANLRIDLVQVASVAVRLDGYGRTTVEIPFRVPDGPYVAQVNPSAVASGGDASLQVHAPPSAVAGSDLPVRLAGNGSAGHRVGLFANLTAAHQGRDPLTEARTDAAGLATLTARQPGLRWVATRGAGDAQVAEVYVVAPADANRTRIVVESVQLDPPQPAPGQPAVLLASVRNVGGVAGGRVLEATVDGVRFDTLDVELEPGEAAALSLRYAPQRPGARVALDGVAAQRLGSERAAGGEAVELPDVHAGGELQADVADSLLGNARAVLSALALTAAGSALVLLVLGARRTLAQRAGVAALLATMWTHEQVQRRAAAEAGVLSALGGLAGILAGKAVLVALGAADAVRPFGHGLPDPFTPLVVLQVLSLLVFLSVVTLHRATQRLLAETAWRSLGTDA